MVKSTVIPIEMLTSVVESVSNSQKRILSRAEDLKMQRPAVFESTFRSSWVLDLPDRSATFQVSTRRRVFTEKYKEWASDCPSFSYANIVYLDFILILFEKID